MDISTLFDSNFSKVILAIIGLIFFSLLKTKYIKDTTTKILDNILSKIKGGNRE